MSLRPGGGTVLLIVLGGFLAWASWFEIDQVVQAQGQVIPRDRTQVIQVADGGVLQALHASEGQVVKAGDLLAILEKARASAALDEVHQRIASLEIARRRALAEATGVAPDFGHYETSHADFVAVQAALFQQNRQRLDGEASALQASRDLAIEERQLTRGLFQSGDVSRVELMRTERQVIELEQKLAGIQQAFRSEARKELTRIVDELGVQRSRQQERESVLHHTDVRAPMDGVVQSLRISTLGGVLRPGDELMQISPTGGGYVVEARVSPADVGQLQVGMPVSIRVDAFDYTVFGTLPGRLSYLSADTLTERAAEGNASVFYRIQVTLEPSGGNTRLDVGQLRPGMTASLDIQTGRRSVLNFITKPIVRAFSGAMTQK